MKLADLSGPDKALRADPLLRLDSRLATLLDGVYRGAEVYTRGLEFMTSLAFGTDVGRWITRNIALPFGGAFLAAEFVWLLTFEQRRNEPVKEDEPPLSFFGGWNASWEFHTAWILLSLFFLAIIRSAQFRSVLVATTRMGYRCVRTIFWNLPVRIWCNPITQYLLKSVPVQLINNFVLKPLVFCFLLWLIAPHFWGTQLSVWIIIFVVSDIIINTRIGRAVDLLLLQAARKIIELIRAGPAVIRWVNNVFLELLDALDWVMARTEDWLRIRGRSGPMAVAVRAVATACWTPIAFLIRFYTVVLIEPMINPLKLPLSILFAKFVYPLLALLGLIVLDPFSSPLVPQISPPIPHFLAYLFVVGTFYLSPDLVTYLFWEMRENWRLYRANLPDQLEPVPVGPYGETVEGLLHVSFHSGTVPRIYARLRKAELEAAQTDAWREARTHRQALRGVEESIRRFVMRDLVAVLNSSPSWGERKLSVKTVLLGTNRISVQIVLDGDADAVWLEWEDRSGWLVAGCTNAGFLARLPSGAIRVFENTLTYLYKRAGVDLIREQIQASLTKTAVHFDFSPNGLLVWYGSRDTQPLLYDPDDPVEELRPRDPTDRHIVPGPTIEANRLVFSRLELTWQQWLEVWKAHDRAEPPRFGPEDWDLTLLPITHRPEMGRTS